MNNPERILNDGEDPLSGCNIPLLMNHTGVVYDLASNIPKPFMNMSFSTQFSTSKDQFHIHLAKNFNEEKRKEILDQIILMFEGFDQVPVIEINSLFAQAKEDSNHIDELKQLMLKVKGELDCCSDKMTAVKSNLEIESDEMTSTMELNNNQVDINVNSYSTNTDMARGDNQITPIKKTKKRKASADVDFEISSKKIKYLDNKDESSLFDTNEDSYETKLLQLINSFKLDDPNYIISYKALNSFCTEVVLLKKKNQLIDLPIEILKNIINLFYKHIKNSYALLSVNVLKNIRNNKESITNYHDLIMTGLASVIGILITITTDKLDKSILIEEMIEDSLDFVKNIFKYFLIPLIEESDMEQIVDSASISLYKLKYNEIMEELLTLTENFSLPDSIIVSLTSLSLSMFFCENMSNSQYVTLNMIKTLFSKYPNHRSIILDDILADITKLRKSKKIIKSYPINHFSQENIHILSSMFLQIIQSCSDLPPTNEESSSSTYSVALGYSRMIAQSLLNLCCKQDEQNIRSLFTVFIEDLLACINLPEWPASDILLYNISHSLSQFISKKQELGLTHDFVGFCIDNLGLIIARARKIYNKPTQPEKLTHNMKDQDICPVCQKEYEGKFMIQCDGCNFWFHGNCVGKDEISEKWKWYCDYCFITRKINEFHSSNIYENSDTSLSNTDLESTKESDEVIFDKVSKVTILNYLLKNAQNNPIIDSARKFWICQWNIDDQNSDHAEFYKSQWNNNSKGAKWDNEKNITEDEFETLTYEGIKQNIETLLSKRKLVRSSHTLLKFILQTMKDDSINLRFKSMRALLTIIEADNNLLQEPYIYDAVKCGFNDSSPKVREKSLNLIGQYILMNPDLIKKYNFIFDCLLDKSVNVRKRIIKILQAICYMNPSSQMVPQICLKLLSCLNSEDSIRELIFTTFRELWFTEDSSKITVPEDLFFEINIETKEFNLQQKINQMLLVISTLYDKKHSLTWIEEVISNTIKKTNYKSIFGKIVAEVIENLIKLNDNDSSIENEINMPLTSAKMKLSCFQALNIISKFSPSLFVDHIDTIHPFIKQDDNMIREDSKVIINALNILENVIPCVIHPSTVFIKEIQSDLLKLIWKQGMNVIHNCIKCICVITQKVTKNDQNLNLLYNRMLEYAIKFKNSGSMDDKVIKILIRSLYTTSLLCKYYDFDDNLKRANFTSFESLRDSRYSDRIENLFKLLTFYKNHKDQYLRLTSIRAIGYLCTYPGILLRSVNIFKNALNDETNISIQNQALSSLQEIITEEEKKMTELSKLSSTVTNKSINETKEALDSSATSIVINTLIQSILKLALSKDTKTRLASLMLVSKVLKMGIVHPLQCISTVIALETDHVDQIHEIAKVTLQEFDPNVIQNRLAEGFLLSFEFQTKVHGMSRPVREVVKRGEDGRTITILESSLSTLYEILVKKKTSCNNFLCSALRLFEVDSNTNKHNHDPLFFQHLILSLATLPFTKEYEILYIIFQINSMNSFQATEAYQNLKRYYESENVPEIPKRDFIAALSSTYLLILKKFLKEYYGITKEKIYMFNPGDVSKASLVNRLFIQSNDLQLYFPKDIFISDRKWLKDEELRLKVFNMFSKELKLEQEEYLIDEEYVQKRPTRGKRGKRKDTFE